jgi:hypothetical protein
MQKPQLFALKFSILVAAFAATPSYAATAWELIASTSLAKSYIDRKTLDINGPLRRVLQLEEFIGPAVMGIRSVIAHAEYDCENRKMRLLDFTSYGGSMGTGEQISRRQLPSPYGPWSGVLSPNSEPGVTLDLMCSVKKSRLTLH